MIKEYKYISIPSGSIRLAITNRCNMKCFYCHNEGQKFRSCKDLNFNDFIKIITLAKKFGLQGISFTGGEPLLNKDIVKMAQYCDKLGLNKIDICTNGILIDKHINKLKNIEKIKFTIGVDRCEPNKISKLSSAGLKFQNIENNIKLLDKNNLNYVINTVYTGKNYQDIQKITEYCLNETVELRIIERDTLRHKSNGKITKEFKKLVERIIEKYKLKKGYAEPGKGYFGQDNSGNKIYFYNAKCHLRDCLNCARCIFRIDSQGDAIPCYAKKLKIPLLTKGIKKAEHNFLLSIYNLGIPPERKTIK